MYETTPAQTSP